MTLRHFYNRIYCCTPFIMKSLRTRITLLSVSAAVVSLVVATTICAISIASFGHNSSEESLRLSCQEGMNSLNDYFDSVEQSADTVSGLIEADLDNTSLDDLEEHTKKADLYFKEAIEHTEGVSTYYYRFDPELTNEKGFWYVDEGEGLKAHEVTDITKNSCPWFYSPKKNGVAEWLLPYDTDSLDSFYVISYNVPIYKKDATTNVRTFVGVVGIEVSYKTLGEQIKDIKVLNSGFAFIVENEKGTIVYHPTEKNLETPFEERPETPAAFVKSLKNGDHHIEYTYKGVKKHCYVMPLSNDNMSIVVCIPFKEVNNLWLSIIIRIVVAALVLIAISIVIAILFSRRITKPLNDLTMAAREINKGNYNIQLSYKGNDEMGILTSTVNQLVENLGGYISDLNALAYADSLTSVRNRSAYEVALHELQKRIDNGEENLKFAIALFDCDDLKAINDAHGHDKGNVYLRNACHLICRIFKNSAVYRIGGDEFVVFLQNEDFNRRDFLKKAFIKKSSEICAFAKEPWEQIRVSVGIATYDPKIDKTAQDVAVHADHLMYANKRERKKNTNN